MARDHLENLIPTRGAVVFHSPVTDLNDLPAELEEHGHDCRRVELGMGNPDNRALFDELREWTGHGTLPQVFIDGRFTGGLGGTRAELARRDTRGPVRALQAGYAGLAPFALGLGLLALGFNDSGLALLAAYGAVILAFVGAIHWGRALAARTEPGPVYVASVVPALVAWVALLLPAVFGIVVLAVGLIGWRVFETRAWPALFPRWFARLRNHLTAGAAGMLLLAAVIQLA